MYEREKYRPFLNRPAFIRVFLVRVSSNDDMLFQIDSYDPRSGAEANFIAYTAGADGQFWSNQSWDYFDDSWVFIDIGDQEWCDARRHLDFHFFPFLFIIFSFVVVCTIV